MIFLRKIYCQNRHVLWNPSLAPIQVNLYKLNQFCLIPAWSLFNDPVLKDPFVLQQTWVLTFICEEGQKVNLTLWPYARDTVALTSNFQHEDAQFTMKYIKFKTFLFCLRLKKCAKLVLSAWENGEEEPAGHKRVHFRVGRFSPFSRILLLIKFARISVPKKTILSQKYPPFSKNYTSLKNKNTL